MEKLQTSLMKYGMFIHYVEALTCRSDGTIPAFGQAAEEFDVEAFADSLTAFGVEYIIFTAWHYNMVCLYPSAKVDAWLPGHSLKRDLVGEILAALRPRGIRVLLYTHPRDGHDFTEADAMMTGWGANNRQFAPDPDPETFDRDRWNDFINDAYGELVDRYGKEIIGLYLDEGSVKGDSDRLIDYPRLRETIVSRAPHLVMIQNFYGNLYSCDIGDKEYCHWGEFADPNGDVWPSHAMPVASVMAKSWMAHDPVGQPVVWFTAEALYRYLVLQCGCNTDGFGVQWAAGPYAGGGWEDGVAETMTTIGRYVEAAGPSVRLTKPSEAFVTKPGTRICDLEWGIACTSPDGRTEYLHVLRPPDETVLHLPLPANGKRFLHASLLSTGQALVLTEESEGLCISLAETCRWDPVDTVIQLSVIPQ